MINRKGGLQRIGYNGLDEKIYRLRYSLLVSRLRFTPEPLLGRLIARSASALLENGLPATNTPESYTQIVRSVTNFANR